MNFDTTPWIPHLDVDAARAGMELEAEERRQQNTRRAVRKALVASLPEEFEIPETLLEQARRGWDDFCP